MTDRLARLPFGNDWRSCGEPTPNVYDVRSRLAMYRQLVEHTNRRRNFGPDAERHPLWGYASQLAWQHRSGRLGATPNVIERDSWWGGCNYALSVVPFVAAMKLGFVPPIALDYDRAYDAVLPAWQDALRTLTSFEHLDGVRLAVWRAHLTSITLAVSRLDREFAALPAAEQRFARGWVRMVDLFAAAALRTDLGKLSETGGGGALPSRILRDDTVADLPRDERSTVRRVGALADRSPRRWAIDVAVWRRIMRMRAARRDAERLLTGMLGRGDEVWRARFRALAYAAVPSKLTELYDTLAQP